ncbi:hypothetical protein QUB10_07045 [Microcoleus sp. B5-D4]
MTHRFWRSHFHRDVEKSAIAFQCSYLLPYLHQQLESLTDSF